MFSTLCCDRIELSEPALLDDEEETYWRNVRTMFVSPYFHVLMAPRNWDDGQLGFTALISDVGDLQLALLQEDSMVKEVQVVTPGLVNRTGRWQMHELDCIYAGIESKVSGRERYGLIYVTSDGSKFLHCEAATSERDLRKLKKIFQSPKW